MLVALHDAMIETLKGSGAGTEAITAYKMRWTATLDGHGRTFPCPACFTAGVAESELKALPAKGSANTHYVVCKACGREYSYVEEDF